MPAGVGSTVHDVSKVVTSSDAFKHLGEKEENEKKRKRPEQGRNEGSVNSTDPLFASYLARLRQDVQQQGEAHPGMTIGRSNDVVLEQEGRGDCVLHYMSTFALHITQSLSPSSVAAPLVFTPIQYT